MAANPPEGRADAERRFWDEQATLRGADLAALAAGEGDWKRARDLVLAGVGALGGKRFLDCGCGEGALSRDATGAGATVVGFDISRGMLEGALRADTGARRASYLACSFYEMPFPEAAFDAAGGMLVLHHVDLAVAARELRRVLAPGGRASFIETWQQNRLLRLARRLRGRFGIKMYGSAEERPLMRSDVAMLRRAGFDVRLEFPSFVFFRLLANNVFAGRRGLEPLVRLCHALDRALDRVPPLRRFGYYAILHLRRR